METYREPLRTLIGKYEAEYVSEERARNNPARVSKILWRYFAAFPRKSNPNQFSLADSMDYRVWRRDEGAQYSTIRKELCYVRAFFSWLVESVQEYRDLPIPVVIPAWPEHDARSSHVAHSSKTSSLA